MTEGFYRLADCIIHLESLYDDVHQMCRDYRTDGSPDYCIVTSEDDIRYESVKSDEERRLEGLPEYKFTAGYLETLSVYRKIVTWMMQYRNTFLFHGSVVAVDGEAYIFTAKSGTGKSTHTRLWRKMFGERAVMVNDDKPLLRVNPDGTVTVFGTPWDGKHHLSTNIAVPLKAVCLLERSAENHIEPVSPFDHVAFLMQQMYRGEDGAMTFKALRYFDAFARSCRFYRLGCNMNDDAALVAYKGMQP